MTAKIIQMRDYKRKEEKKEEPKKEGINPPVNYTLGPIYGTWPPADMLPPSDTE